jgi:hypothetical protein
MKLPENVEGSPLAVFDSTGLVFGISAAMMGGEGYVSCSCIPCEIQLSQ